MALELNRAGRAPWQTFAQHILPATTVSQRFIRETNHRTVICVCAIFRTSDPANPLKTKINRVEKHILLILYRKFTYDIETKMET